MSVTFLGGKYRTLWIHSSFVSLLVMNQISSFISVCSGHKGLMENGLIPLQGSPALEIDQLYQLWEISELISR